jgi:hypothetical protein
VLTPLVFFVFACIMAVLSAVHSYLVVLYAGRNKVAKDVGFYYMANAGGRLVGTLSSGLLYQYTGGEWGIVVCLWVAAGFLVAAAVQSLFLRPQENGQRRTQSEAREQEGKGEDGGGGGGGGWGEEEEEEEEAAVVETTRGLRRQASVGSRHSTTKRTRTKTKLARDLVTDKRRAMFHRADTTATTEQVSEQALPSVVSVVWTTGVA